jgi:hypothetical protein
LAHPTNAQNKFTAVGRVFPSIKRIRSKSRSKVFAGALSAPNATPIAAATPIAGAPRMTIARIASAT